MTIASTDYIWLDGEYVSWQEANIHSLTHTLHYGVGVFEGVRAYETANGPAIFRLACHTRRFFRSARMLNMPLSVTEAELNQVQQEILKRNRLKSAYIRPMAFYGSQHLNLKTDQLSTHVLVSAWEWGSYFQAEDEDKGIRMCTSTFSRHHRTSVMCKAKANGNYINSVLAIQEARSHGYDDAMLLDQQGLVAESSSANIFIVVDGIIYTPNTKSILEGITRASIITLARDLGYQVIEKDLTRDDIYIADEMFLTGTAAEVTAVSELDGRPLGAGRRGDITRHLQQQFHQVVTGKMDKYRDWFKV